MSFCEPDTVSGESVYGHVRNRNRYRNLYRMANFEVDTDTDDLAMFNRVNNPQIGTQF
ncbi:hypothetical protein D3OALGA1CA_2474 [Olavius algarvensis associated proteobacterium Delta 3]|nr:hypothetical protein D3OALGA1CA_2474 [Olavius algarvensis associated proteobacterium Delta 3]CAB5154840.1 hypothetical protein D3OALGB2SA_5034 [Olavius algarvensis associated proteobacterium Delta 3]